MVRATMGSARLSSLRNIFLLALAATGCPAPDPSGGLPNTGSVDNFLDYNDFVCNVEPVLVKRCSYLACHGNDAHALRVYSLGKLRAGPTDTRKQRSFDLLTSDEVEANFASASGMVYGATNDQRAQLVLDALPLLRKPLAARSGGDEHLGVAIFPTYPSTDPGQDPEFLALAAWVQGAKQSPPDAACKAMFTAMGINPR